MSELLNRFKQILKGHKDLGPDPHRTSAVFAQGGDAISVETALNSRCNSDRDGRPEQNHWGLFDNAKKIDAEHIDRLSRLVRAPRISDGFGSFHFEGRCFTFFIDPKSTNAEERDLLMIESGMQQQALGLICAAIGVGMAFRNLGPDGKRISNSEFATIQIAVDAMLPSYNRTHWSILPPSGNNPWKEGNLPDPNREGNASLINVLSDLRTQLNGKNLVTGKSLGQLLWAARGRTPHLYLSRPWGLTIPTWAGQQDISSIYLFRQGILYRYSNWEDGAPTNSIFPIANLDLNRILPPVASAFPPHSEVVILAKNENTNRAFWEIGYQLLNLLLQASSLDLTYQTLFYKPSAPLALKQVGITYPVAALIIPG